MPTADSGRIIIGEKRSQEIEIASIEFLLTIHTGSWWLIVIVLVTTYCGNLVAFLTFPKIDMQVKTVGELVNAKGTLSWGMREGTYLQEYIKTINEGKYKIRENIFCFTPFGLGINNYFGVVRDGEGGGWLVKIICPVEPKFMKSLTQDP